MEQITEITWQEVSPKSNHVRTDRKCASPECRGFWAARHIERHGELRGLLGGLLRGAAGEALHLEQQGEQVSDR